MTDAGFRSHRTLSGSTFALVAMLIAGLLIWWAATAASSDATESSVPSQEELKAQFDELVAANHEATQAAGVSPYLADPEQRQLWTASYERMTDCFADHGFDGASEVPASFGDGTTPLPLIDASRPNSEVALANCGLDLEGVDRDGLAAAITAEAPPGAGW